MKLTMLVLAVLSTAVIVFESVRFLEYETPKARAAGVPIVPQPTPEPRRSDERSAQRTPPTRTAASRDEHEAQAARRRRGRQAEVRRRARARAGERQRARAEARAGNRRRARAEARARQRARDEAQAGNRRRARAEARARRRAQAEADARRRREEAQERATPTPAPTPAPTASVDPRRRLTQAEVDAAFRGGLAMQEQCLARINAQHSEAERLMDPALAGSVALRAALEKDPDTYHLPTGRPEPTTMRQLAGAVLDTLSPPACDGALRVDLERALRDAPR